MVLKMKNRLNMKIKITKLFIINVLILSSLNIFAKNIMIMRGDTQKFENFSEVLQKELSSDYSLSEFVTDKSSTLKDLKKKIRKNKPNLVILIDNKSIVLFNKFNKSNKKKIPGVAALALNLKQVLKGNKNVSGIAFEVPPVTTVVNYQKLTGAKIKNLLVFYRQSKYNLLIKDSKKHFAKIGIKLVAINVEKNGTEKEDVSSFLNNNLEKEVNNKKIDAIWVITDNYLINKETFNKSWIPVARKTSKSFLCGVEKFATPQFNFCAFSTSPNLEKLAEQTSEQVYSILDDNTRPIEIGVEYVISTNKALNSKKVKDLDLKINRKVSMDNVKVLE
jgi:hypothetical protein